MEQEVCYKGFSFCTLGNFVLSTLGLLMWLSQYYSCGRMQLEMVCLFWTAWSLASFGAIWFYVLFVVLCDLPNTVLLQVCFLWELMLLFWLCYFQHLRNCQISSHAESMQNSQLMGPFNVTCGYWPGISEYVWKRFGGEKFEHSRRSFLWPGQSPGTLTVTLALQCRYQMLLLQVT